LEEETLSILRQDLRAVRVSSSSLPPEKLTKPLLPKAGIGLPRLKSSWSSSHLPIQWESGGRLSMGERPVAHQFALKTHRIVFRSMLWLVGEGR
jgi:hypothetical protein